MLHYIEYTDKDDVLFKIETLRHLGLFDESVLKCVESYIDRYFTVKEEENTENETVLNDIDQLETLPQILVKGLLFDPYIKECTLL